MEEYFEIAVANKENDYILNGGINRGYVMIPKKIVVCYLLNQSEKHLYSLMDSFVYGEKRTCFPSIEKLMGYSGWTRRTLKKHMDGLHRAKLYTHTERPGTTNLYCREEIHKSPTIIHSEMLHQIREEHFKRNECRFNELLEEYRESPLKEKVSANDDPLPYYEEVESWFLNVENLPMEEDEYFVVGLESVAPTEKSVPKEETTANAKIDHLKAQIKTTKSVSNIKNTGEFNVTTDPDKARPMKKSKDYNKVPVEEWNTHHFIKYFEDCYKKALGFDLPTQRGDLAQIKALLERYKQGLLKERIELFFNSEHFKYLKRNIYTFSSGNVQSKLDGLLNSDRSVSYKGNKRADIEQVSNSEEAEQLKAWLREIGAEG